MPGLAGGGLDRGADGRAGAPLPALALRWRMAGSPLARCASGRDAGRSPLTSILSGPIGRPEGGWRFPHLAYLP